VIESRGLALAGVVIGATVGCFAINVADAQPASASPVELIWNAPPGCSDSAAILKQVTALRGGRSASAEHLMATANVTLDPSGVWSLQIATTFADGTRGERQIQAESCKAAADATASILALALTARTSAPVPSAAGSATPIADGGGSPVIETSPIALIDASANPAPAVIADAGAVSITAIADAGPAEARHDSDEIPAPSAPNHAKIHGYAGLFVGGTVGDLPSIGLGGGGLVGATYGNSWVGRLELYGDYFAFGRARFPSSSGGANFQVFSAGLRTCVSVGGTVSVGPCAAFELGSLRAQSFDVSSPSSGSALAANGFLGALARLPLGKNRAFALRALLEIGAAFERPQFVLDGVGFVHQPAPLLGRGTVGAELRF